MVNWQRGVMRLMRITNHEVAVTQVEDFTDYYRRIHFTGPELLAELSEVFPTLWTRLWFPHPDKGEGQVSQRGYTFVDIDLATGAFSLDFVIHGDEANSDGAGPASRWAARATPGTTIEAALTPARIDLPADTNHILLAGDLTALPAVNSWLEAIPAEVAVTVTIEDDRAPEVAVTVTIEDDRAPEAATSLPRASHPNARWKWNLRDGAYGHALADHVRSLGLDADGLYVWAAGERGLIKQIRTVVKQDLGLKKDHYFSEFYWFDGKPTG